MRCTDRRATLTDRSRSGRAALRRRTKNVFNSSKLLTRGTGVANSALPSLTVPSASGFCARPACRRVVEEAVLAGRSKVTGTGADAHGLGGSKVCDAILGLSTRLLGHPAEGTRRPDHALGIARCFEGGRPARRERWKYARPSQDGAPGADRRGSRGECPKSASSATRNCPRGMNVYRCRQSVFEQSSVALGIPAAV